MLNNSFAMKLQHLIKQSNIKNTTLANAVQYDLSYISKWLNGKMLPSEKNIDEVIERIVSCIVEENNIALIEEYACNMNTLPELLRTDLHQAYDECRPKKIAERVYETLPITEVVQLVDFKIQTADRVGAIVDIFTLPHENRLILAGIRNGHFAEKRENLQYDLVINTVSNDYVYDSIFLIHMLTSMSGLKFNLYSNGVASGKMMYSIDGEVITSFLFPGNKDCIAVSEWSNGKKIQENIIELFEQETLIFRKSSIKEMLCQRDYIQFLVSTNIRWILGHATELLLPKDVFDSLIEERGMDKSSFDGLYRLSQNVVKNGKGKLMIYESAIANLAMDGIVDFYNQPVVLSSEQVIKCLDYYADLMKDENSIKLISGGFSDDFMYITNPCMFLSDSLCYVRLENNRYENNIHILNDKAVKEMFDKFFDIVWSNREDVVIDKRDLIHNKIQHYKENAKILHDV